LGKAERKRDEFALRYGKEFALSVAGIDRNGDLHDLAEWSDDSEQNDDHRSLIGARFMSDGILNEVTELIDDDSAWTQAVNPKERTGQWRMSLSTIRKNRVEK
jgi:hypothetical protein